MPRLIHLNGPTGIGKSTVAQLYADRHPGVLNLDTDQVVSLIGGWKDDFWGTLEPARRLAIAMAETHLRTGRDVVMPQLVTNVDESERFEAAARGAGADYREIVLMGGRQQVLDRFAERVASGDQAGHRYIDEIVERGGGPVLLARIHGHVTGFVRERPRCVVVHTDGYDPQQTYDAVIAALASY
jgi:predicted ABC-type ATPase